MTNIHGENVIQGSPVHKSTDYRIRFAKTPVFTPEMIPAGRAAHIGNGVFRRYCAGDCGTFSDRWGGSGWDYELAKHEHETHGLDVVGYNVAMLP